MGMVVLRFIRAVMTPPAVSIAIPRERERNVEKTRILSLLRGITRENGGLDNGTITIDDSLIRVGVDALVGHLTDGKGLTIRGYEWNHRPRLVFMDVRVTLSTLARSTETMNRGLRRVLNQS